MIYGDKPYKYLLSNISITQYSGKINADLKNELLNTIPMLRYNLKHNRLRAADQLANWVANNTLWSISEATHVDMMQASDIYYNFFGKHQGGVYCAGTATFLNKIYNLFGYKNLTIDTGLLGTSLTHVTNYIGVKKNNRWKFYLMDPTMNQRFFNRHTGQYATISTILKSLKSNHFENDIFVKQESTKKREYLLRTPYLASEPNKYTFICNASHGKSIIYLCHLTPGPFAYFTQKFHKLFLAHHFQLDNTLIFQFMQRRILGVSPNTDPGMRSAYIKRMKNLGIPVNS